MEPNIVIFAGFVKNHRNRSMLCSTWHIRYNNNKSAFGCCKSPHDIAHFKGCFLQFSMQQ